MRHSGIPSVVLFAGVLTLAGPVLAQEDGSGGQGSGNGGNGGPTVDLPLIGEVPVPGFLAGLFGGDSDGSGGSGGSGGGQGQGQGQGNQQPPAVIYQTVEAVPVTEEFEFLGRIQPIERVRIVPRVTGFIEEVAFEGGQQVQRGDLLFEIEADRYAAAVESAEAQLNAARAQVESAQASAESAEARAIETQRQQERTQELRDSGTVAQAQLEDALAANQTAQSDLLAAEASVRQASASVDQAQANLRQARIDLDYTTIVAPIDGQMSEPLETRGNSVSAGGQPIATLTKLDPIWGVFALGERRLFQWRRLGIGGGVAAQISEGDAGGGGASGAPALASAPLTPLRTVEDGEISDGDYRLQLLLPDGSVYADEGQFDFVGSTVNTQTGTVEVRVRFDNPDDLLLPNLNVRLAVSEADPPVYPVVPQAAVQLGREGRSVWVVQEDDTVVRRPIQITGGADGGMVAVTEGIREGERVVVRGALQLSDGQEVDPRTAEAASSGGSGSGSGGSGSGSGSGSGGSGGDEG